VRRRESVRHLWRFCCLAVLLLPVSSPLVAQAPPIVERLSPDTILYLDWRGSASLGGVEKKNHLLKLLADPTLAPLWVHLTSELERNAPKGAAPVAPFLLPDLVSLLDNEVGFGIVPNPDAPKAPVAGKTVPLYSTFFVYDLKGKADLIQKWRALSVMSSKTPLEVTKYDFGGISVEVRTTANRTSYIAQTESYLLASDQKKVIEDLISRFRQSGARSQSITGLPEYGQIRKYVGNDLALEVFGRMPDLSSWNASPSTKSIHLERIHAIGGGVSFSEEATRVRGAIVGDTSPGGPFDLAGASAPTFETLPVIEAAPAFSVSRIHLAALYRLFMNAVIANLPGQAAQVAASEKAAEGFLGMPIIDALELFTGEIGSMTTFSDDGAGEQLFAVSIQKPEAVLRIVRALAGTMIVSEDSAGTTTYLDLAYPYLDPQTHLRRRKFYYLAIAPQMLLAAPRKAMLRQAAERLGSEPHPAAGVCAKAGYTQLRSRLPERLSGLGVADLSQIPWDKVAANLQSQAAQNKNQQPPDWSWLKPELISHYLDFALSGWWKDANGVYFDSYIQ
jgi:hypothetical protein